MRKIVRALTHRVERLGSRRKEGHFLIAAKTFFLGAVFVNATAIASLAQPVRPDGSFSTEVESVDSLNFSIDGGDRVGDNLFHSFDAFSVLTGGSAEFLNEADIKNIVGRVIGNSPSNIDGLIRASGGANLFLINPGGIVFGEQAQLDIGGSFIGSTAESLRFSNGVEFSAFAPVPTLSVGRPTGLRLGSASREIRVDDVGYQVLSAFPLSLDSSASLQVKPGNTFALVGNGIEFEGGAIATPGGRVELGSVQNGLVTLLNTVDVPNEWILSYDEVQEFDDIELLSQSLMNTSDLLFGSSSPVPIGFGASGGSIQLQGRQISVRDGSVGLVQNFGDNDFGSISVNASDSIEIRGLDESQQVSSGFSTAKFGSGQGGNINIDARQLYMTEIGQIITETFGQADGGNLVINVSDGILINRFNSNDIESGQIFAVSYGPGNVGGIEVETKQLDIEDSGISSQNFGSGVGGTVRIDATEINLTRAAGIASASLGEGQGGDLFVNADVINIVGVDTRAFFPSTIAVSTIQSGNAGNLTINTQQLRLQDGGRIDASTFAEGDAGTVVINAGEFVEVQGTVPGSINPSLISSTANEADPALRAFFEALELDLPDLPSGNSGDVTINTPALTVSDGAQVTARNDGSGDAGLLTVNANTIKIADNAGITASTQQGSGGNVVLNVGDVLLLRRGGQISAEAGGIGDGGNVTLSAPALVALENSDIIANAVQGNGGNVQINAQGIIGSAFRDQLTSESDITASSEFGVSGVVEITNLKVEPSSGIVALPENVSDVSDQVVAGCESTTDGQFVASGRGGLPPNPINSIGLNSHWHDVRSIFDIPSHNRTADLGGSALRLDGDQEQSSVYGDSQFAEATAWASNPLGQIVLTAESNKIALDNNAVACLRQSTT